MKRLQTSLANPATPSGNGPMGSVEIVHDAPLSQPAADSSPAGGGAWASRVSVRQGWFRAVALAAALSACGGGAVSTYPPAGGASGAPRAPASAEAMLALVARPDSPGPDAFVTALGRPDVDRREGAGAMLAWRLPDCALALGFAADSRGRLHLTFVQADAPRPGAPVPTHAQCVASARARSAPTS